MAWFSQQLSMSKFSSKVIKEKLVRLLYCPTELMIAEALTKALSQEKFSIFNNALVLEDTRIHQSESVWRWSCGCHDCDCSTRGLQNRCASWRRMVGLRQAWGQQEAGNRSWLNPTTLEVIQHLQAIKPEQSPKSQSFQHGNKQFIQRQQDPQEFPLNIRLFIFQV